MHELPSSRKSWRYVPPCPWCGCDISQAPVALEDVLLAHEEGGFQGFAYRDSGQLNVDCPGCSKPLSVELSPFDMDAGGSGCGDGPELYRKHATHARRAEIDREYASQKGINLSERHP